MTSESKLVGLVGQIYDAAADDSCWPAFLESFVEVAGATTAALVSHDLKNVRPDGVVAVRYDASWLTKYAEYYYKIDSWRLAWERRLATRAPTAVALGEELIELSDLKKTEFFNDYLRPQDSARQFGGPIAVIDGRFCYSLTCLRPEPRGPFQSDQVELLWFLFRHLKRAAQFQEQFADLRGKQRACLQALDLVHSGVVLMDEKGRVSTINRAAQCVLDLNDGLRLDREGLSASRPDQTKALRAAIGAAANTATGKGLSSGRSFAVERPSGKRPFSVVAMPVSPQALPIELRRPAVIVFINDPEAAPLLQPELLVSLYGLTAAESRLAGHVMHGETLVRAAELLGISHNTARTHLQRIYAKTGTRHQSDLVRLLLAAAPKFFDAQ